MYNVQRLSFQKLCQCNVDLRIDFNGIGTCFDIVNWQHWGFILSCPVESLSPDDGTTAAAMFSNLKARLVLSTNLLGSGLDLQNFEKKSDLSKILGSVDAACSADVLVAITSAEEVNS